MKKVVLILGLIFAINNVAYADGNAFTPLNFNDTSYGTTYTSGQTNAIQAEEAIGNGNIQNAITQLENAQVDIRNDLLNYQTKFSDIDSQYKLIKAERATLKKQLKNTEKRIKELEKAKVKIKNSML
ncbi:MAG: hypothetical protein MJ237_04645 [bacterium]|nr:hypothetical protein [bacterium]